METGTRRLIRRPRGQRKREALARRKGSPEPVDQAHTVSVHTRPLEEGKMKTNKKSKENKEDIDTSTCARVHPKRSDKASLRDLTRRVMGGNVGRALAYMGQPSRPQVVASEKSEHLFVVERWQGESASYARSWQAKAVHEGGGFLPLGRGTAGGGKGGKPSRVSRGEQIRRGHGGTMKRRPVIQRPTRSAKCVDAHDSDRWTTVVWMMNILRRLTKCLIGSAAAAKPRTRRRRQHPRSRKPGPCTTLASDT